MKKKKEKIYTEKEKKMLEQVKLNEFHWGSTGILVCTNDECVGVFKVSGNNDLTVTTCPYCGCNKIIGYENWSIGKAKL
jgi:hypothetical protein